MKSMAKILCWLNGHSWRYLGQRLWHCQVCGRQQEGVPPDAMTPLGAAARAVVFSIVAVLALVAVAGLIGMAWLCGGG